MTRGYPIIILGVAFFVCVAALLVFGPHAADDMSRANIEAIVSAPLYFMLTTVPGLLLLPTLFYLLAFGTICAFISAWPQHPRWRFVIDALFACFTLPLLYSFLHSRGTQLGSPALFFFTIPCIAGIIIGVVYSTIRRLVLR
jgi:hypothetical protein